MAGLVERHQAEPDRPDLDAADGVVAECACVHEPTLRTLLGAAGCGSSPRSRSSRSAPSTDRDEIRRLARDTFAVLDGQSRAARTVTSLEPHPDGRSRVLAAERAAPRAR
ncbi:hypothetical protein GCM10009714_28350 [Microlunatus capsulatus]